MGKAGRGFLVRGIGHTKAMIKDHQGNQFDQREVGEKLGEIIREENVWDAVAP